MYEENKWIGQKYNMLTVIGIEKNDKQECWMWKCKCDCGNTTVVKPYEIINNKTHSCGCLRKSGKQVPIIHGDSHKRLHNLWWSMLERCEKPTKKTYKNYGGRGIKVCEEWHEYINFKEWALSNGYADDLSIERIDVNGNYCPENCKWIPMKTQARNRRTTHYVDYDGERISLAEACERANLPYKQVFERIVKSKWSEYDALHTPIHDNTDSARKKCKEAGINYYTYMTRVRSGWSEEKALNTPTRSKKAISES